MKNALIVICVVVALAGGHICLAATHHIELANGKSFDLKLPDGFGISVAADGLKRVRFMARSPDDRIFVTDMYYLTDNKRGVVYILEDFDPTTRKFKKGTKYLSDLSIVVKYRPRTPFPAHSSPLGLEYFDSTSDPALANSFLVALHGSTKRNLRRGYNVVKVAASANGTTEEFITGFFDGTKINGRPADVFSFGKNAFLLTDDHSGVVYYVYRKP